MCVIYSRDEEMATPTMPSDGGEELAELKKNIDDVFILTNAIIVCLMQCGFACLEAGAVRSKNTTNIIMKNFMDIFISALCYWLAGYALAYGDGNPFVGYTYWAGIGVQGQKMAHWFFQFVFAATAATLVSGAVAERCNFVAYITYSAVISGFVYPVVSRWVWAQEGWLNQMGYRDFSGCGPVHLLGGTCSLFGAAFLGPRLGRFSSKMEDSQMMPGHSVPLTGLGGMILIAGFLAFNGGTLGTMTNPRDSELIARVISNTVMGGSGGSITVMLVGRLGLGGTPSWSFMCTLNGAFIGMVSVCAGVNEMNMWESFVSGIIAGPIYMIIHYAVLWCKIDDPLDTVAIHLGGGVWGLISASIFSNSGLVFGITRKSLMLLAYRMAGATIIFSWASVTSCITFGILKCTGKLRVSAKDEQQGLDISLHNEPGYPVKGWQTMVVSVQGNSV
ncbi:putative ammonium transporter 1 isoform X1 [Cryptotermes secundus]|uniref:putative ammonium transporter 1 isoform X1 n=1 Tax=Cryptotermes secundus TaxID=105785 RepID=UPI000CD7B34F|nr:putative ammonium transporter 1 isoform X1 [Cryptotermes secundus]